MEVLLFLYTENKHKTNKQCQCCDSTKPNQNNVVIIAKCCDLSLCERFSDKNEQGGVERMRQVEPTNKET